MWKFYLMLLFVKIWRIICAETSIEILLLAKKWKLLLAGLVFQVIFQLSLFIDFLIDG